jgi:DNA replication protein DnaC
MYFGLQPLAQQIWASLLGLIEDRHAKRSPIIIWKLPVNGWYDIIREKTLTDAILNRIVHWVVIRQLAGESLKMKVKKGFSGNVNKLQDI